MRLNLLVEPPTTFGRVRKILSCYLIPLVLVCSAAIGASIAVQPQRAVRVSPSSGAAGSTLDDMKRQLARCSDELVVATRARGERAMRQRTRKTPREVVEAIARTLPESTALTALRIGLEVVEVQGRVKHTRSVAEIAERLATIPSLKDPRVQTFHALSTTESEGGDFLIIASLKNDLTDESPPTGPRRLVSE